MCKELEDKGVGQVLSKQKKRGGYLIASLLDKDTSLLKTFKLRLLGVIGI